jgi:hypothetical protein
MVRIIVRTPMTRRRQQRRYVVITVKGVEFAEHWYAARRIPPHMSKLYQLLLGLIWMRGIITVPARLVNRQDSVVNQARLQGYVTIEERPHWIPTAVQHRIGAMIGDAPRWIYA